MIVSFYRCAGRIMFYVFKCENNSQKRTKKNMAFQWFHNSTQSIEFTRFSVEIIASLINWSLFISV